MRLDDFDFALPRALIADRPCEPRDAARLLVLSSSEGLEDRRIADLPARLRLGDLLVFNDTKVIPARLTRWRPANLFSYGDACLIERALAVPWFGLQRPVELGTQGSTDGFRPRNSTANVTTDKFS
jgi:S-adenosylmethionine:tRNA ribosyltransferase-isomerase